ncbi:Hypothetical predicted protein [Olea europaea subsp. europaea]|uniref:Protein PALE CRESS, chloroplastic n=1 Tax=Olea europaea subsp. europaea TaxID=158383 RepID=A0A8S0VA57_OLEEU|nr:Hypothetical predicted protein [Olea europaea subsp. europaea]
MLQAPVTTLEVTTGITNDENVQLRLLSTVSTIIETSMTSDNHHYLSSCHPQPTGKSSQQGPWLELESSCVHINGDGDKSDDDYFANGSRQLLCGKEKLTFRPNCFIKSAEEVEEKIEEAAEKGELNELVLLIIWNRLDLARRDDEKDAVRSLDLLYRRVETEILKREATPAMRLLNDLLNLHDGFDDDGWLKACKKRMIDTFPREDPFSILVPAGFDIDKHQGPVRPVLEADDVLLRVEFVREVNALLREVRLEQSEAQNMQGLDPESVASRLKQQEKQRAIHQVEALLDLAINLNW